MKNKKEDSVEMIPVIIICVILCLVVALSLALSMSRSARVRSIIEHTDTEPLTAHMTPQLGALQVGKSMQQYAEPCGSLAYRAPLTLQNLIYELHQAVVQEAYARQYDETLKLDFPPLPDP